MDAKCVIKTLSNNNNFDDWLNSMSPIKKITLKNQVNKIITAYKKYKNKNTTISQNTKENITTNIDGPDTEYIGEKDDKANKKGFDIQKIRDSSRFSGMNSNDKTNGCGIYEHKDGDMYQKNKMEQFNKNYQLSNDSKEIGLINKSSLGVEIIPTTSQIISSSKENDKEKVNHSYRQVASISKNKNFLKKKTMINLNRTTIIKIKLLMMIIFLFILYYVNKKNIKKNMLINLNKTNSTNLKVCLCTLGKKENRYIREFINYYKRYGVDNIFLYDNNDIDGERFEEEIFDYLKNGYVKLYDYRGKNKPQFEIFTHCYENNNEKYNWLLFYDIDEFINLKNLTSIKEFLSNEIFKKCKLIYLNCIRHTDNDLLLYDNRTLAERFPYINWKSNDFTVKSMVRGKIKNIQFKTSHWLDRNISGCNSIGEKVIPNKLKKMKNINNSDARYYYIDHYCFKSTEEYISKLNRGDAIFGFNYENRKHKINLYFSYNKITMEKINFIEKGTGLNLKEYKLKLNNKSFFIKI